MEILRIPDVERQELIARIPGEEQRCLQLGTLGPAGTSSEYVARMMSRSVADGGRLRIVLEDTYERCVDALTEGRLDLVLVAHAYPGINAFYMHPGLEPASVFRGCTPEYGLAIRDDFAFREELLDSETVVSHPAPIPLLRYHLGRPLHMATVDSTSQAACDVADGRYNVAITNEEAARQHHLKFVYKFDRIPMTWTVFARRND
jgi:bacilysin biosynthesis protein BacA